MSETRSPEEILLEREAVMERVLEALPDTESEELVNQILLEADRRYAYNFNRWLADQVMTIDEADNEIKRWPIDKVYLGELNDVLTHERAIGIPKSRRMLVTWDVAAYLTWKTRYYPGVAGFWMSETETKAAYTVSKRCAFIEDNLRTPALRRKYDSIRTTGGEIGKMTYDLTRSYIWALASGANVMRAFTPSVLVLDESDFQEKGHESFAAALPFLEKRTQLIVISSSNGPSGVLAQLCKEANFVRFAA